VKGFQDYHSLFSCRDYQCHLPFTFSRLSNSSLLFKDYQSLLSCRDNQGHLPFYFSKTIIVFCLAETIKVICSFTFQRLSESFVLRRLSMSSAFTFQRLSECFFSCRDNRGHLPLYFSKTSMSFVKTITIFFASKTIKFVGLQRPSRSSSLYISKTPMSFVKTTIVFFTFLRLSKSCILHKQSRSSVSLHYKDLNVFCQDYLSLLYISKTIKVFCFKNYHSLLYFSKTIRVFCFKDYHILLYVSKTIKVYCLAKTIDVFRSLHFQRPSVFCFKDYQSLLSRLQCLLCFSKLQGLLFDVPDASYIPSFDRFQYLGFR